MILYFKIKKIEEDFQRTKTRLQILSARLQSYQNAQKNQAQNQNQDFQAKVLSTINNLPASNAFASFYVNKLSEEKTKLEKEKQNTVAQKPIQSAPTLPPLKTLIAKSKETQNVASSSASMPPPVPEVSMIICSNGCYAVSSSGQVYANGFIEGDYKLVVTQNQVYWEKVNQSQK